LTGRKLLSLLDGKVAIITGAGGGLGSGYAKLLASEGASVVVNDFQAEAAQAVVAAIEQAGGRAVASVCDVSRMESGESILKTALDAFGRVDILVNNAGILRDKGFAGMTEAMWDAVVAVHLKGTFCVTQPIFRWMKENGNGGVIISTSSASGLGGNIGQTNYGASKAGNLGIQQLPCTGGKEVRYPCVDIGARCQYRDDGRTAATGISGKMGSRVCCARGSLHGQRIVRRQDQPYPVCLG
jgi:NAD(P)-dependent dehydrogenase (short-subunit alcohol dehydrogenase family)